MIPYFTRTCTASPRNPQHNYTIYHTVGRGSAFPVSKQYSIASQQFLRRDHLQTRDRPGFASALPTDDNRLLTIYPQSPLVYYVLPCEIILQAYFFFRARQHTDPDAPQP
jgi:hypothetical protein